MVQLARIGKRAHGQQCGERVGACKDEVAARGNCCCC